MASMRNRQYQEFRRLAEMFSEVPCLNMTDSTSSSGSGSLGGDERAGKFIGTNDFYYQQVSTLSIKGWMNDGMTMGQLRGF